MTIDKLFSFFKKKAHKENPKVALVGTVLYFNRPRGYGYIGSKQLHKDAFVHISDTKFHIRVGDAVKFEVESNEKGLRARNVELIQNLT